MKELAEDVTRRQVPGAGPLDPRRAALTRWEHLSLTEWQNRRRRSYSASTLALSGDSPIRRGQGPAVRRSAAVRPLRRRPARVGAAIRPVLGSCLRTDDGDTPADAVRARTSLAGPEGRLSITARHRPARTHRPAPSGTPSARPHTRDVLDDLTLDSFTNTAACAARRNSDWRTRSPPSSPSTYPHPPPHTSATKPRGAGQERALIYDNRLDQGGRFAAWDQPQLSPQEVRAGLRPLRPTADRRPAGAAHSPARGTPRRGGVPACAQGRMRSQ
jgi:hypothetical protein